MWFKEVYLPKTTLSSLEWRLLILDEYFSHVTDKFMELAAYNKV